MADKEDIDSLNLDFARLRNSIRAELSTASVPSQAWIATAPEATASAPPAPSAKEVLENTVTIAVVNPPADILPKGCEGAPNDGGVPSLKSEFESLRESIASQLRGVGLDDYAAARPILRGGLAGFGAAPTEAGVAASAAAADPGTDTVTLNARKPDCIADAALLNAKPVTTPAAVAAVGRAAPRAQAAPEVDMAADPHELLIFGYEAMQASARVAAAVQLPRSRRATAAQPPCNCRVAAV